MNLKEIKELIDLLKGTEVVELEVERGGSRVKIRRGEAAPSRGEKYQGKVASIALTASEREGRESGGTGGQAVSDADHYTSIVSPIVGTFYRSSSPDKDPYVEVGDMVKKGQVVCIVEAMKLMNEIESEVDGKVVEILAENQRPVEYGEPLFRIEPIS